MYLRSASKVLNPFIKPPSVSVRSALATLQAPKMAKLAPLPFPALIPAAAFVALAHLFCASAADSGSGGGGGGGVASLGDLLRGYGLPGGLLPKAVDSFAHDAASGLLEVRIARTCYARYGDGLAFFDREVRGNLSYGALRGVVGWSQEELFLWLPVKGILVSDPASGVILFDIGLARKRLALSSFEDPPECLPEGEDAFGGLGLFGRRGFWQQR